MEVFSSGDIHTTKILSVLIITYLLAMYIYLVYRFATKNTFFYKNYGISMTIISVITAGIILAMQSSLVISLGMVGALSIIRFRTAIKDPLDLLFLFWSISIGIICGASLFELAIYVSLIATFGIILFQFIPVKKSTSLLVLNADDKNAFDSILQTLQTHTNGFHIKAKNTNSSSIEIIAEIHTKKQNDTLSEALLALDSVSSVHILENDFSAKS